MTRRSTFITGLAIIAICAAPATAWSQVKVNSRAMEITLTGRVHAQFNTTSVNGELESEFLVRRARFTADLDINDVVSGRVQPDFGEGEINLKDAYVRFTFSRAFRVTAGQFKRPFDVFELTSSTQILVVERAGGIRGVSGCTGPGGVCSLSRLTEKLGFADRDIGVMIDGRDPSGTFAYSIATTNGTGANQEDENSAKSFSGRVAFTPVRDITIAANVGLHDYVNEVLGNEYAAAYGGDLEIGNYNGGIHLVAGVVAGENWANLSAAGAPSDFLTTQGILTYKAALPDNRYFEAIEPVGRVSWSDPDTNTDDDGGILLTPGLVLHFTGRNKIGANVDIWMPSTGDTEMSLKVQSYLHF